ncbi:MAG: oligosaccharide flippase family protein [Clostridia bacterium]|nr:oligosaccharide flippase family protein [Clostridia bacterium]
MAVFNQKSRTENARLSSILGVTNQLMRYVLAFVYRTVFLMVLTKEYLGLDGLFTNILAILQLAELGIGTAIVFRMYKPIQQEDVHKVAAYMNFYKWVYRIIALVVLAAGLILLPFLDFFIKDASEVPADLDVKVLYLFFLAQSVTSYLFVYKQSILTADQKGYTVSIFSIIVQTIRYAVMFPLLVLTKNYTLTLGVSIGTVVVTNYFLSLITHRKYREVFRLKDKLTKEEKKEILKDTSAMMCHKAGEALVFGIDSILVSKYVGTGMLGIYSNYSLLINAVTGLLTQFLGSFIASLGNMSILSDDENKMRVYKRLIFLNNWVVCFCTVSLFVLINPFIRLWQGEDMLLSMSTVAALSASFFINNSRWVTNSYITASGLFIKDRWRPFLQAAINLVASVLLVQAIGITGIFVGTIISCVVTIWWREPHVLHKYELHASVKVYWIRHCINILFTAAFCVGGYYLSGLLDGSFASFMIRVAACLVIPNGILLAAYCRTEDFRFYLDYVLRRLHLKKNG